MSVVKLAVIDAIAAEVEAVSSIKTVMVCPSTPIERDSVIYPSAFLFDEDETVTPRNRLEFGTFLMHVEIWAEGVAVRRMLEDIRGEVKKNLYNSEVLKGLSARIRETTVSHFEVEQESESEDVVIGMGGIVILYEVAYLTKYRDPFTQLNY